MHRAVAIRLTPLVLACLVSSAPVAQRRTPPPKSPPSSQKTTTGGPYTTPLTLAAMTGKQAVVNTTAGDIVIDLRPDLAPNHVGYFMNVAGEGGFDGTIFHRVVRLAIIQGGDPLSKDPAKARLYGTGGLGILKAEFSAERASRGAVAAVLQPNRPDSAGSQFFICVTDQPPLDGKYTIFGRVSEGMDVVQRISEAPADADGRPNDRIVITHVTIRDAPPPEPVPFANETAAQLAQHRAVLETSKGAMTLEFFPDKAPEHVKNFLRLAHAGVFDGTAFHRVVPGFVVQTGALNTRGPLSEKQQKLIRTLPPEFSDTPHVKGILSMARGDDPASASTSFFLVTGTASSLDGKYTVFGRVVDGLSVLDAIEQSPVNGEAPVSRIDLVRVRIVQ
jgi:cyclophilin family peptidyl-prolyl cis-trans isomerase